MKLLYNLGIRLTGFMIFILCLSGMIATILLSIAKNIKDISNITIGDVAYIFTVCFVGLSIFSANCYITSIKKHYQAHYNKILFLRTGLLIFMVYNNYQFFINNMNITTVIDKTMYFILCVLIDFGIITLLPFALDRMLLNFTEEKQTTTNIFKMLAYNLLFTTKIKIEQQYKQNLKMLETLEAQTTKGKNEKIEVLEVSKKPNLKLLEGGKNLYPQMTQDDIENENTENIDITEIEDMQDAVSANDLRFVKDIILKNKNDDNSILSVSEIEKLTGLTKRQVQACKRQLEKNMVIKTIGNKTYVLEVVNENQ